LPHSPTDYRRFFRRDYRRNHRRVVARMPDTCPSARIPMEFLTFNTDALPTDHACLTRVHLHEYRWNSRRSIPTDHACLTRVRLHEHRRELPTELPTERKSLAGFLIFLVRISINFRRNYRRKLIAPTTINFRR